MEFQKAVTRPFQDAKTFLLGVLFSAIPIVNLLAVGYYVEILKATTKKNFDLLKWGNYKGLFVKGLVVLIISFVYGLVLGLVLAALSFVLVGFATTKSLLFAALGKEVTAELFSSMPKNLIALLIIAGIIFMGFSYYMSGAIANFSVKGKFKNAFEFKEIENRILTKTYLKAWLIGTLYLMGVMAVLIIFAVIDSAFLFYVLNALATFITNITFYTLIGEAWAEV